MSTFDGFVKEFPHIRIDYFRPAASRPPPLACFLSHVHSDHLQGLESFRSPFIYCSAATRELLLRLERRAARLNFAKGFLETREVSYRHLRRLVRPIPLDTPTVIELAPGNVLRVTLIDANHCPGSVMFLLEDDTHAVLYTGDVRAEMWWVNAICRNPVLVPYVAGIRVLDMIYLDTTFATKRDIYKEFQSKEEGIRELLQKVSLYPEHTHFYFHSWTLGYEQAWLALAAHLRAKIHVDEYKMNLFKALSNPQAEVQTPEAPALCGFRLGNGFQPGILTLDSKARLHNCEKGLDCSVHSSSDAVHIIPIVKRTHDGVEVPEQGAGGGYGNLEHNIEIELRDRMVANKLIALCENLRTEAGTSMADAVRANIQRSMKSLTINLTGIAASDEQIQLERLPEITLHAIKNLQTSGATSSGEVDFKSEEVAGTDLPRVIRFPYSRHSSYSELRSLVEVFKPRDLYPCTVDQSTWHPGLSMQTLFGDLCRSWEFVHDQHMLTEYEERQRSHRQTLRSSQDSGQTVISQEESPENSQRIRQDAMARLMKRKRNHQELQTQPSPKRLRSGCDRDIHRPKDIPVASQSTDSEGLPRMASRTPQPYYTPPVCMSFESNDETAEHEHSAQDIESQLSIGDSAFGSQGSLCAVEHPTKIARRKEAYKAAKGRLETAWSEYSTIATLGFVESEL